MPKKREYTPDGMKMIFESGNKSFDRSIVSITPNDSIGGGMTAFGIRAYNNVMDCFDNPTRLPGQNQAYDLKRWNYLPLYILAFAKSATTDKPITLHEFYHYRAGRQVTHGWLFVRSGKIVKRVDSFPLRAKSCMVLDEAEKYLSDDYNEAGELIKATV